MKLSKINEIIINKSEVLLKENDDIEIDLTFEEYVLILDYLLDSFDKIKLESFNVIPKIKYLLLPINKFVNNYIIFGKYEDKLIENDIHLPKFTLFDKLEINWCELAATNGHLECLKYAHENGCPWNSGTCKFAAENSHLECLKYAHENGCPYNKTELLKKCYINCKQYIKLHM